MYHSSSIFQLLPFQLNSISHVYLFKTIHVRTWRLHQNQNQPKMNLYQQKKLGAYGSLFFHRVQHGGSWSWGSRRKTRGGRYVAAKIKIEQFCRREKCKQHTNLESPDSPPDLNSRSALHDGHCTRNDDFLIVAAKVFEVLWGTEANRSWWWWSPEFGGGRRERRRRCFRSSKTSASRLVMATDAPNRPPPTVEPKPSMKVGCRSSR